MSFKTVIFWLLNGQKSNPTFAFFESIKKSINHSLFMKINNMFAF